MEGLFKKLDNLMTSDIVRKLGGLGAGDLLNSGKKPESAVETEDHSENGDTETADEEETDEDELDEDE